MGVCRSLCAFICPLINPGQCSLWPQSGQPEHSALVKARYISIVLKSKRVQETAWKISTLAHSVSFFWASIFFLILPSFSEVDATYSLNYYKYSHSYLSTSDICFHPPHLIPIALCLLKLHGFCLSTSSKKNASKLSILIFHYLDCTHYTSFFQIPRCCMWQHCLSDACNLQSVLHVYSSRKEDMASLLHVSFFFFCFIFILYKQTA